MRHAVWLIVVQSLGRSLGDIAEPAIPGTNITTDQKRCGAGVPALILVWTGRALAHRIESVVQDKAPNSQQSVARCKTYFEPLRKSVDY
jgi:hypothetical protein